MWTKIAKWLLREEIDRAVETAIENERVGIADNLRRAGYHDIAAAVHRRKSIPDAGDERKPKLTYHRGLRWK